MIPNKHIEASKIEVGVVGLGLMGSSIAISFLLSGHTVIGIAPIQGEKQKASLYIRKTLAKYFSLDSSDSKIDNYLRRLTISEDYRGLKKCHLVLECVIEKLEIKKQVYKFIVDAVSDNTAIATNTSAIPIGILQQFVRHPNRFLGIHWAEPAFNTRFLEIICGEHTNLHIAQWVYNLAHQWGKEPTLLKKDIRGFITNRLMYASFREALFIVRKGLASRKDVDKCFRYDFGSWMTLMGVFRRMDYTGFSDFRNIFDFYFPLLSNDKEIPLVMQTMVDDDAKGIHNRKGLYHYSEESSRIWKEKFSQFIDEIAALAKQYPSDLVKNETEEIVLNTN